MRKILLILGVLMSLYAKERVIVFGAGCFWGVQKHFSSLKGVLDTKVGYAGGNYPDPTYEKVLEYRNNPPKGVVNYTESVKVVYDDSKISTEKLIKEFWELHDPTQGDRQGNDIGNNYRSAIFYTDDEQKEIALKTKEEYQKLLNRAGYGKITTVIAPLEKFYPAEEYHQDYLKKHPFGYCPNHATGVKFPKNEKVSNKKVIEPLGGKEIVVVESEDCPYCKKFKEDVLSSYKGDTPLREAKRDELKGFEVKTELNATPVLLFFENGKEVYAHKGYMDPKSFYKALGAFKLGVGSEAYNVAFNQGTDNIFCKRYDKFKDTGDGVFVDILSGQPLFDTKDRFNSHSGWLSFFKAIDGAVEFREDYSYGMHRTEVLAKVSGIHLGHVFDDAPGGKQRFCINASVLEFKPRKSDKK